MNSKKVQLSIKVDKNDKELATRLFNDLGLNISTAINMFLKKSIAVRGIPFTINDEHSKENTSTEKDNKKEENH